MDEPAGPDATTEDFGMEGPAAGTELEDEQGEDFLRWLTVEERECLQYLLETIKSLEEDLSLDNIEDGPGGEANSSENRDQSPDDHIWRGVRPKVNKTCYPKVCVSLPSWDHLYSMGGQKYGKTFTKSSYNGNQECKRSTIINTQARLQLQQMTSGENEKDLRPISHLPNDTSVKLSKPASEDGTGDYVSTAQENLNKLVNLNPSYLRKFDTIMKSGVNVQELRARFVGPPVSSAMEEESKATETSSSSKKMLLFPGGHTSPREKALQKLGLLKRNQAMLTTSSSQDGFSDQDQTLTAAVQSTESLAQAAKELGSSSAADTDEPLLASDEGDHQEALQKLRLLQI